MTRTPQILAIDQGTSSSRAFIIDANGQVLANARQAFKQYYPHNGWVEHDPEEIWSATLSACQEVLQSHDVVAIGITNQRETVVVWDRTTGKPIHPAIVWQDRRTTDQCSSLKKAGHELTINAKTGLVLDPYFSATKIAWILDHVDGARDAAESGNLACGTIDSFLLWRLTKGKIHATDATNASRTLLYNIHDGCWDSELLQLFNIPASLLPEVKDCAADYGETDPALFGKSISISGVAGDQHAAMIGQCCFSPGMIKSTYGTGCFVLVNTGDTALCSKHRLLTTLAYQLDGKTSYALEGSIFIAGAAIQWLRDELHIIKSAEETETLVSSLDDNKGVYLVPAFTGLGAPHWQPEARGALYGLVRNTGPAHITRAALESVCYQTNDLLRAMVEDGIDLTRIRVDGGMAINNWLMQFLADILNLPVERPNMTETTVLGAAYLAGLQKGVYDSLDDIEAHWEREQTFSPSMAEDTRKSHIAGWEDALRRTIID